MKLNHAVQKILAGWLIACSLPSAAHAFNLHGLPPEALSLWVAPVEGEQVVQSYRDQVAVSPASTMKLLTSWVALERLGPDFQWTTKLVSDAAVVDGVLQGDVYWVGQGDPHFFSSRLTELLQNLRLRGIRRIAGRLLLDDSAYHQIGSADGFDADEGESFMAPPQPTLANLNVVWLRFFNDDAGPRVVLDPPLPGLTLDARLSSREGGSCADVRRLLSIQQLGLRIVVRGVLPRSCDDHASYLQPLPADRFAAAAFAGIWQSLGGEGPVSMAQGIAPASARVLARVQSDSLARILPDINKNSSNPMARSVFLTLGRLAPVTGNTAEDAIIAIRQTLAAHHLPDQGLVLENGSGLSRRERISARLLGEMLRQAARGPYAAELMASLPVAGEAGTLRKRFTALRPNLRLKTGTLASVASLAGYWQGPDGRRWVIVALAHGARAAALRPSLDAVVRDVIQQLPAGRI
jgi:D-alanyl-D-alanine carboxypeptidase/D-alanyl-D-alanine-endopeptidase (penicillin-binding protein 4)